VPRKHGGEFDEAEMTRASLRQWEAEQGQEKEELLCPVWASVVAAERQGYLSTPHGLAHSSAILGSGASTPRRHSDTAGRPRPGAGHARRGVTLASWVANYLRACTLGAATGLRQSEAQDWNPLAFTDQLCLASSKRHRKYISDSSTLAFASSRP